MKKVNIKPRAMTYPAPAIIVSTHDENKKADAYPLAFEAM